jgi:hypothetical protein
MYYFVRSPYIRQDFLMIVNVWLLVLVRAEKSLKSMSILWIFNVIVLTYLFNFIKVKLSVYEISFTYYSNSLVIDFQPDS